MKLSWGHYYNAREGSNMLEETSGTAGVIIRTLPPVAVSAFSFLGLALQEWVYVATIIYTGIQILRLMPKVFGCIHCLYVHGTCPHTCKE